MKSHPAGTFLTFPSFTIHHHALRFAVSMRSFPVELPFEETSEGDEQGLQRVHGPTLGKAYPMGRWRILNPSDAAG